MNSTELVAKLAAETSLTKIQAHRVVRALFDPDGGIIPNALVHDGGVTLPGFGSFKAGIRKARRGASPVDGKPITISERKVVRFKAGKTLAGRVALST